MLAAISLGLATALKLTPCLFGCLYLSDAFALPRRIPWKEISIAALSAVLLVFVPFAFFGGVDAIPAWLSNAIENARFYSAHLPLWGFVPLANQFVDSAEAILPSSYLFAAATRVLAVVTLLLGVFARSEYRRLLYIGATMAFLTYHDYGGAYLIPAFVAWLCEADDAERTARSDVLTLLEMVAWFVVLTPLQLPKPFFSGSLNAMLQNEFLFVLLAVAAVVGFSRKRRRYGQLSESR